jgi:hypothetical protein
MNYKFIIFGIIISLTITSCMVYHPKMTDIPLISKKKELKVDAGVSIVPSAYATISYGLTDKIAIQSFASISDNNIYSFQEAVGYFKDLGNQKVMELYTGFGYGLGRTHNDANPGNLMGDYQLYFAQFNYGKINCQFAHMDYGLGIKAGYLYSDFMDRNYYDYYSITGPYTSYKDHSFLIEPNLFLKLGGEKLKFSLKLGSIWINKFTNKDKSFPYTYINLGLGLNYKF